MTAIALYPLKIPVPEFDPAAYDFSLSPAVRRLDIVRPGMSFFQRAQAKCTRPWYVVTGDYYIMLPCGTICWIPAGFCTDFASTPRLLHIVPGLQPTGTLMRGSPPHDFGYRHQALLNHKGEWIYVGAGRKVFDQLMRDINIRDEHDSVNAHIAYYNLRSFGWIAWSNARKKDTGKLNLRGAYAR